MKLNLQPGLVPGPYPDKIKDFKSTTMPVQHVKGHPAASTCVQKKKGWSTFDTNRESPCSSVKLLIGGKAAHRWIQIGHRSFSVVKVVKVVKGSLSWSLVSFNWSQVFKQVTYRWLHSSVITDVFKVVAILAKSHCFLCIMTLMLIQLWSPTLSKACPWPLIN